MANVKGSALATRVTWVRLNHGQDGIEQLCEAVSPGLAGAIRDGVAVATWYPFAEFIELNTAIDRLFGQGDGGLIRELGRWGAEANMTTIYRLFYKVGTVRWVMARAARLWYLHYDAGRLSLRELSSGEIELAIEEFPTPSCVHCQAVQGWAERSVELSGGELVKSELHACRLEGSLACRLRARWT
ncbi:MAG TPA: hypothetical protein VM734_13330 [Kofleriaceae bacterium]|nr:hypothetical protein [Kofleriaceae bacterium]